MVQAWSLAPLNERFALSERLCFVAGPGDLPVARIDTPLCRAEVSLYGGHVLTWERAGGRPVLFLSERSAFEPGLPIRGGIPVCWPWFADHPDDPALPLHGLARTRWWQMLEAAELADGTIVLALGLSDDAQTRAVWPHAFRLELTVALGRGLDVELATVNTDAAPIRFTEALHSYFRVGDAAATRVVGLEGASYVDKLDHLSQKRQTGPVEPVGGVDYVYTTEGSSRIEDSCWQRTIHIAKRGSRSTVLFNPGPQRARTMADLSDQAYRSMVCVETANALNEVVELAPGQTGRMGLTIAVESMP